MNHENRRVIQEALDDLRSVQSAFRHHAAVVIDSRPSIDALAALSRAEAFLSDSRDGTDAPSAMRGAAGWCRVAAGRIPEHLDTNVDSLLSGPTAVLRRLIRILNVDDDFAPVEESPPPDPPRP